MWTRCLGGFSVMWVTKLLISPVKKRIFCPKTTKSGPKLAFLVNLGQAMQAYLVPCWWIGRWLWRAGCISQDTYLLYWYWSQSGPNFRKILTFFHKHPDSLLLQTSEFCCRKRAHLLTACGGYHTLTRGENYKPWRLLASRAPTNKQTKRLVGWYIGSLWQKWEQYPQIRIRVRLNWSRFEEVK